MNNLEVIEEIEEQLEHMNWVELIDAHEWITSDQTMKSQFKSKPKLFEITPSELANILFFEDVRYNQ